MTNYTAVEKRSLSEYLTGRNIVVFLFSFGALIAAAQAMAFFTGADSFERAISNLRMKNHPAQWFVAVVMAFSAFVSASIAQVSANKRDRGTWRGMALLLTMISAAQVISLRDFFGGSFTFSAQVNTVQLWWGLLAIVAAAGLWAGHGLQQSLRDSSLCIKPLFFGTMLYVTGAMGDAVLISTALYGKAASAYVMTQFVFNSLFKMFGIAVFFYGLVLHEEFLCSQMRRVSSGRLPVGLPAAKTESAAWALRMIDTPTRDEQLMQDEVSRATAAVKQKQGSKAAR